MSNNKKIIFANQLRGLAALMVVLSHIGVAFWGVRDVVGYFSGSAAVDGSPPFISAFISNRAWNFGALGVSIFFMISGFVIPMSLSKTSKLRFMVGRLLRIYPTYIVALGLSMLAVWASTRYWNREFMWDAPTLISNMLLINSMVGIPSVDLVNWTLAIELKFYLVICLMSGLVMAGRVLPLLAFSVAIFCANLYMKTALGTELLFVSYMMIGVLFNYLFRGLITVKTLCLCSAFMMSMFMLGWDATYWPGGRAVVGLNYIYGFALFAISYAYRHKFNNIRILDFLADISYPLYVVHSLVSYGIMRVMLDKGLPVYAAMSLALVSSVAIAYAIHRVIEKPTMHMGKKLRASARAVTV